MVRFALFSLSFTFASFGAAMSIDEAFARLEHARAQAADSVALNMTTNLVRITKRPALRGIGIMQEVSDLRRLHDREEAFERIARGISLGTLLHYHRVPYLIMPGEGAFLAGVALLWLWRYRALRIAEDSIKLRAAETAPLSTDEAAACRSKTRMRAAKGWLITAGTGLAMPHLLSIVCDRHNAQLALKTASTSLWFYEGAMIAYRGRAKSPTR